MYREDSTDKLFRAKHTSSHQHKHVFWSRLQCQGFHVGRSSSHRHRRCYDATL